MALDVAYRLWKIEHDVMHEDQVGRFVLKNAIDTCVSSQPVQYVVAIAKLDDLGAAMSVRTCRNPIVVVVVVVVEDRLEGRCDDRHRMPVFDVVLDEKVLLVFERLVVEVAEHHDLQACSFDVAVTDGAAARRRCARLLARRKQSLE